MVSLFRFLLVSLVFTLGTTTGGHAASFDCTKATTEIEIAICDDPRLSELDESIASVYFGLDPEGRYFQQIEEVPADLSTRDISGKVPIESRGVTTDSIQLGPTESPLSPRAGHRGRGWEESIREISVRGEEVLCCSVPVNCLLYGVVFTNSLTETMVDLAIKCLIRANGGSSSLALDP